MRIFARRIEHPLDVPIERPHHADARMPAIPGFPVLIWVVRRCKRRHHVALPARGGRAAELDDRRGETKAC